jgi:hypothetical protein
MNSDSPPPSWYQPPEPSNECSRCQAHDPDGQDGIRGWLCARCACLVKCERCAEEIDPIDENIVNDGENHYCENCAFDTLLAIGRNLAMAKADRERLDEWARSVRSHRNVVASLPEHPTHHDMVSAVIRQLLGGEM